MSGNTGNIESPFYHRLLEVIREDNGAELSVDKRYLESIVDAIPGGLIVYQYDGSFKNLYISPKIADILGMTMEEYEERVGHTSTYNAIYEPDRELIKKEVYENIGKNNTIDLNVRFIHKSGELKWVNIYIKAMKRNDMAEIYCGIVHEISAYSQVYRELLDEIDEMMCVADCATNEIIYANNAMKDRFLNDKDYRLSDLEYYSEFCRQRDNGELCYIEETDAEAYNEIKNFKTDKNSYNIKSKITNLYGRKSIVICISDVTENFILKSRFDEITETMACSCIKCKNDELWTVVEANNIFYDMIGYSSEEFKELKNNSFAALIINSQEKIKLRSTLGKYEGTNYTKNEYPIVTKNKDVKYIVDQSIIVEEEGQEYYYSTFFDITERKLREALINERYQKEISYRNSMLESLFTYCAVNLTSDMIVEWNSKWGLKSRIRLGMTVKEALDSIDATLCDSATMAFFYKEFNVEKLLKKYKEGNRNYTLEKYIGYLDGSGMWVSMQISLKANPETKAIEGFLYVTDITDEKYLSMAINKEIIYEYDFIACIDAEHNRSVITDSTSKNKDNKYICADYEAEVVRYADTLLLDEDRGKARQSLCLETVLDNLSHNDVYEIVLREIKVAGDCKYKRIKFSYLDKEKKLILFSQMDVTKDVERENKGIREKLKHSGDVKTYEIITDFIEKKEKNWDEILKNSQVNNLTGLLNIDGFSRKVKKMLNENPDDEFYLVVRDINNFKVFNELYGRSKGDEFLKYIADNYSKMVNDDGGVCGYLGSDDFVACYKCKSIEKFEERSRKMKEIIKKFPVDYKFTDSAGVYKIESINMPVTAMCDRAEVARNEAKKNMRTYGIYDDKMRERLINSQEIVNDFPQALKNKQFHVFLQPQYNIYNGKIVGAEALVRWIHPVKGTISPCHFIPILEQNGLISQLDRYIAEEVCRIMSLLRDSIGSLTPAIAVNLSRADIFSPGIISDFNSIIERYGLPHIALRLEMTESVYVSQPQYMTSFVNKLRSIGYKVEMDDFGSGYSSLNALKDLEIDLLKLDMEFLSSINTEKGAKIIKAVVAMADAIGVPVLTEGVETKEQVDFLKSIGCKYVQGYYFAKPMSIEDYIKLMLSSEYEYIKQEK